jgi:hypothetical protein
MRRLRLYLSAFAWQTGVGYLALWVLTFWALDHGAAVFGRSGVCHPDAAKVLFYWVCDGASPYAILAALANFALTVTAWAPVYIAAATVEPRAIPIALSIVLSHMIGLPAAIFVLVRLLAATFDLLRAMLARMSGRTTAESVRHRSCVRAGYRAASWKKS